MKAKRQGRYGHSQLPQAREKIRRKRQKVWVIAKIRVNPEAPSKILEREFIRKPNLRQFCIDQGIDNRNLRKTLKTGGWCSNRKAMIVGPEGENGIVEKYGLRACLDSADSQFVVGCERHSQKGVYDKTCEKCKALWACNDNKPIIIWHGDKEYKIKVFPNPNSPAATPRDFRDERRARLFQIILSPKTTSTTSYANELSCLRSFFDSN